MSFIFHSKRAPHCSNIFSGQLSGMRASLLLLLSALSLLPANGCMTCGFDFDMNFNFPVPDASVSEDADTGPVCGNGVAEGTEVCDGADFRGQTCESMGFVGGTLECSMFCATIDTSSCKNKPVCGNGKWEEGEECDCGKNPDNIPLGCLDRNGGPKANCDASCHWTDICGVPPWGQCDQEVVKGECCPDSLGNETECSGWGGLSLCMYPCANTRDCYYNSFCDSEELDGHCRPANCGPGAGSLADRFSMNLNDTCLVTGGRPGWCRPVWTAEDRLGICCESGTVEQGGECDPMPPGGNIYNTMWSRDDPNLRLCDQGECLPSGICAKYCDWQDVYDHGETCPENSNCVPQTYFYREDPQHPDQYLKDGTRWADAALCLPMDPVEGTVSCDLVTGELTSDRTKTCADMDPDPTDATPMVCTWPLFGANADEPGASPMGMCAEAPPANLGLYDACDDSQASPDVCPEGTVCMADDLFVHPDQPEAQAHCLPFCDTQGTACADMHPELPAGFTCTTLSNLFAPGTQPGTTSDGAPSRLGLCACTPSGCQNQ